LNKPLVCLVSSSIVLSLGGCAPNVDQAKAAFCKDLGAYAKSVAAVGALGQDSTVDELRKAVKIENDAYKKLDKAANRLSAAQSAAIKKVDESFAKTTDSIKGNEKLGDAATTMSQATSVVLDKYSEIATTTCAYGSSDTQS
jgi:negative regulator of replication initiation